MLSHLLREAILPPGCFLIVLTVALLVRQRAPRASGAMIAAVIGTFYLLSIPPVSIALSRWVENETPLDTAKIQAFQPQAIVVLGGGAEVKAPEYGGLTVPTESTLKRVAYAAYLAKATKLPVLVTGGYGRTQEESESWAMKFNLEGYGVTPRWCEAMGKTTAENAALSQSLLAKDKIERILLVTSASHARRARRSFEKTGLAVLAAPTGFRISGPWDQGLMKVVPAQRHFDESVEALRAMLAETWYYLRGT
jgi:uncharacterized SAM-binding protein YcdF (DUF218 family)